MVEEFINVCSERYGRTYRNYFPDLMKEKLNLNDNEYIDLYEKIKTMSMTELREKYPEAAKVMDEIRYETEKARQNPPMTSFNGHCITEAVTEHLEIQGIGCINGNLEKIPEYLLIKAERDDIIIVTNN